MITALDSGNLEPLFHPSSIALVGISLSRPDNWIRFFLDSLLEFQFTDSIYPVNPGGGEIRGLKVYPSLDDIPDAVDYVISMAPAQAAAKLVEQCADKGVRAVHFFAAGFGETGEEEGVKLEYVKKLMLLANAPGIRS